MASIRIEIDIEADAAQVWEVIGDWADGPARMAPGYVRSSRATDDVRVVTFADGFVARERLITRDDEARRIVYSLIGDTAAPEHDNAVMRVVPDGPGRCRLHWARDVLPADAAQPLSAAMHEAAPIIKRALESGGHS
jgi:hypothetical protein